MAYVPKMMREKLSANAEYERQMAAIKRVKGWVPAKYELHTKITAKAVLFPTHGWVPKVAIAGRTPDGVIVPWAQYREGYEFLLADWFAAKKNH